MSSINSIQANIGYTPNITNNSSVQQTVSAQESAKTAGVSTQESAKTAEVSAQESAKKSEASAQESAGAVYEKSSDKVVTETKDGKVTEKANTDRSAIIKKLQDDVNAQKQQLLDIVRQSMGQQAATFGIANSDEDGLWSRFANGDFTVTEAAKVQAQKDISEDGYWGVEQTSDRILDFAKTLAGNDPSKAEELLDAFKKGYEQATKSWGKELPGISSQTYDAVTEKFQKWMDESKTETQTQAAQTQAAQVQAEQAQNSVA